jgi:hypothetical protein
MSHFRLIPTDQSHDPLDFDSDSIRSALNIAYRQRLAELDVWRDNNYFCSLRLSSRRTGGFWMIFQKGEMVSAAPPIEVQKLAA